MAKKDPRRPLASAAAGWNNPFTTLAADGLPTGEPTSAPTPATAAPAKRGRVVLRKETAHRGGKPVIIVYDFPAPITAATIEDLARRLKKACGAGGTVKGREIEIQGDQAARIRALLEADGFRVAGVT